MSQRKGERLTYYSINWEGDLGMFDHVESDATLVTKIRSFGVGGGGGGGQGFILKEHSEEQCFTS